MIISHLCCVSLLQQRTTIALSQFQCQENKMARKNWHSVNQRCVPFFAFSPGEGTNFLWTKSFKQKSGWSAETSPNRKRRKQFSCLNRSWTTLFLLFFGNVSEQKWPYWCVFAPTLHVNWNQQNTSCTSVQNDTMQKVVQSHRTSAGRQTWDTLMRTLQLRDFVSFLLINSWKP